MSPAGLSKVFQSTPPRRRRLCSFSYNTLSHFISIHASAKEATNLMPCSRTSNSISIHASAKEATLYHLYLSQQSEFQSTPPRRRRQFSDVSSICFIVFQSTPPRRRRQVRGQFPVLTFRISIHASAKEATLTYHMIILLNQFQSTPPRRRRLCSPSFSFFPKFISIHASAKEATSI